MSKIEASDIYVRLRLEKGKDILLSVHREGNIDTEKNFTSLFTAIKKMAEKSTICLFSTPAIPVAASAWSRVVSSWTIK